MATLRLLREQRYLTQEQLAVAAEVSASTVYHIEAGRGRPRTAILRRLARALGVDPEEIDLGELARASGMHGQGDGAGPSDLTSGSDQPDRSAAVGR